MDGIRIYLFIYLLLNVCATVLKIIIVHWLIWLSARHGKHLHDCSVPKLWWDIDLPTLAPVILYSCIDLSFAWTCRFISIAAVARSPSGTQLNKHQFPSQPHPQVPPRATPPRDTFSLTGGAATQSPDPMTVAQQSGEDNGFVVHKGRGVPTLTSMHQQQQQQDPLIAARLRMAKEKTNADSKAEERGELLVL